MNGGGPADRFLEHQHQGDHHADVVRDEQQPVRARESEGSGMVSGEVASRLDAGRREPRLHVRHRCAMKPGVEDFVEADPALVVEVAFGIAHEPAVFIVVGEVHQRNAVVEVRSRSSSRYCARSTDVTPQ